MRDAFGGVFMLTIMLLFITILVAFGAISLKYAKSFRTKNAIIDFVEQSQITDISLFFSIGSESSNNAIRLKNILSKYNYNNSCEDGFGLEEGDITNSEGNVTGYCQNGVLIRIHDKNANTINYDIYTYVNWDLGILNKLLLLGGRPEDSEERITGSWLISGEAVVKY